MEMQFLVQQAWWFPGLDKQCLRAGCDGQWVAGVAVPHQPWPAAKGSPALLLTQALTSAHLNFSLLFLLKHAQPGNKTGTASGAFVMDTENMKHFLVG